MKNCKKYYETNKDNKLINIKCKLSMYENIPENFLNYIVVNNLYNIYNICGFYFVNFNYLHLPKKINKMLKDNIILNNIITIWIVYVYDKGQWFHQTMLFINNIDKIIFRFNPWGYIEDYENLIDNKLIKKFDFLKQHNYKYYKLWEIMTKWFQKHHDNDRINEVDGYCMIWSLWFAELYVNNNNVPITLLFDILHNKFQDSNLNYWKFIRWYCNNLINLLYNVCEKSNLNIGILRNEYIPDHYLNDIEIVYNNYLNN